MAAAVETRREAPRGEHGVPRPSHQSTEAGPAAIRPGSGRPGLAGLANRQTVSQPRRVRGQGGKVSTAALDAYRPVLVRPTGSGSQRPAPSFHGSEVKRRANSCLGRSHGTVGAAVMGSVAYGAPDHRP